MKVNSGNGYSAPALTQPAGPGETAPSEGQINLDAAVVSESSGTIGVTNGRKAGDGGKADQTDISNSISPTDQRGDKLANQVADAPTEGEDGDAALETLSHFRKILTSTNTQSKEFRGELNTFLARTPTAGTRELHAGLIRSAFAMPFLQTVASIAKMSARGNPNVNNMPDCVQPFLDSLDALLHETDPGKRKTAGEKFAALCNQIAGMTNNDGLLEKMRAAKNAAGELAGLLDKEFVWGREFNGCLDRIAQHLQDDELAEAREQLDKAKALPRPSDGLDWEGSMSSLAGRQPSDMLVRLNDLEDRIAERHKEKERKIFETRLGALHAQSLELDKGENIAGEDIKRLEDGLSKFAGDLEGKRGVLGDDACNALKSKIDEIGMRLEVGKMRLEVGERLLAIEVEFDPDETAKLDKLGSDAAESFKTLRKYHWVAGDLLKAFPSADPRRPALDSALKRVGEKLELDFKTSILKPFSNASVEMEDARTELSRIEDILKEDVFGAKAANDLRDSRRNLQNRLDALMKNMDERTEALSGLSGTLKTRYGYQSKSPSQPGKEKKKILGSQKIPTSHKASQKAIGDILGELNGMRGGCETLWMQASFLKRRAAVRDRTSINHLGRDTLSALLAKLENARISDADRASFEDAIRGRRLTPEFCGKLDALLRSSLPGRCFRVKNSLGELARHANSKKNLDMTPELRADLLWALRFTITPDQYDQLNALAEEMSGAALTALQGAVRTLAEKADDDVGQTLELDRNLKMLGERAAFHLLPGHLEQFTENGLKVLNENDHILEFGKTRLQDVSGLEFDALPEDAKKGFVWLCRESWCDWLVMDALTIDSENDQEKDSLIRKLTNIGKGGAGGIQSIEELLRDLPAADDICLELENSLVGSPEDARKSLREYTAYRHCRDLRGKARELASHAGSGVENMINYMLKEKDDGRMIGSFLNLLKDPDKAPLRVDDIDLLVVNAHFWNELAKHPELPEDEVFDDMYAALPEPYKERASAEELRKLLALNIPGTRMANADAKMLHSISKSLFRSGRLMKVIEDISLPPEQAQARKIIATAATNVLGVQAASGKSPDDLLKMLFEATIQDAQLDSSSFFEDLAGLMMTTLGLKSKTARDGVRAQLEALNTRCELFNRLKSEFEENNGKDALALAVVMEREKLYSDTLERMYAPGMVPENKKLQGSHLAVAVTLVSLLCDPDAELEGITWEQRRAMLKEMRWDWNVNLTEMHSSGIKRGKNGVKDKDPLNGKFFGLLKKLDAASSMDDFHRAGGEMLQFLNSPPPGKSDTLLEGASAVLYFKESKVRKNKLRKQNETSVTGFIEKKMGQILGKSDVLQPGQKKSRHKQSRNVQAGQMQTITGGLLKNCNDVIGYAKRKKLLSMKETTDDRDQTKINNAGKKTEKTLSPYFERIFDNLATTIFMQQFTTLRGYGFAQAVADAREVNSGFRNACLGSLERRLGIPADAAGYLLDQVLGKIDPEKGIQGFADQTALTLGNRMRASADKAQQWLHASKNTRGDEKRRIVAENIDSLVDMVGKDQVLTMNTTKGGTMTVGMDFLHEKLADVGAGASLDLTTGINITQLPDGSYIVNVLKGADAAIGVEASAFDSLSLTGKLDGSVETGLQFVFSEKEGGTALPPRERVKRFLLDLLSGVAERKTVIDNCDAVAKVLTGSLGIELGAELDILSLASKARDEITKEEGGEDGSDLLKANASVNLTAEKGKRIASLGQGRETISTDSVLSLSLGMEVGVGSETIMPNLLEKYGIESEFNANATFELNDRLEENVKNGVLLDAKLTSTCTLDPEAGDSKARAVALAARYGMEGDDGFLADVIRLLDQGIKVEVSVERTITRQALEKRNAKTGGEDVDLRGEENYILDRIVVTRSKQTATKETSVEFRGQEIHNRARAELTQDTIYFPPFAA